MSTIDYVLRGDPQPEKIFRFPMPCPLHPAGDEARLDFKEKGWDGRCSSNKRRHTCRPQFRLSFLCDMAVHEYYCKQELPVHLRNLTK